MKNSPSSFTCRDLKRVRGNALDWAQRARLCIWADVIVSSVELAGGDIPKSSWEGLVEHRYDYQNESHSRGSTG